MGSYRGAVMDHWASGQFMLQMHPRSPLKRVKEMGHLLRYGLACGRMSGRVKKMNVSEMVDKWIMAISGMCTAHSKDDFDAHDAKADELMTPILSAPIKQVREFYALLGTKLRETPTVPMLVWMGFDAWGEIFVKDVDDEGIKRLKNKLAREIADIVEMDVREQIPQAIARALRWRDPETLKEVKSVLESGAKPKLVGRQSCLFLEVGRGKNKKSVML